MGFLQQLSNIVNPNAAPAAKGRLINPNTPPDQLWNTPRLAPAAPPRRQSAAPPANVDLRQVTQLPAAPPPQSVLAIASADAMASTIETVRRGIESQASGEPIDGLEEYVGACKALAVTPEIEQTHVAAAKSFQHCANWPAERDALLEKHNADEAEWYKAEKAADLALTRARQQRRASQHAIAEVLFRDREHRAAIEFSPFLHGPVGEATKFALVPSLTFGEIVQACSDLRYPLEFAIEQLRQRKAAEFGSAK